MPNSNKDNTLLLIDCHALIHRAYHAFPPTLTNSKGELTNAVYGFASLLLDVLIRFKPSHVVAVFDAPGDTVRHDLYSAYKANRSSPDQEMVSQIPRIEQLLETFDIPILRLPGYEADDVIGTIDDRHSGEWAKTIIVTGDRDLLQLVDEDTFVYLAGGSFSASKLFGVEEATQKMGVAPEYIVDLKALQGDASDNIPGVSGIGQKGAESLIKEFGHIEELFNNIDRVPNRYRQKLENSYEIARTSKQLATIILNAPIHFDFSKAPFGTYQAEQVLGFFREMEFKSLESRLTKLAPAAAAPLAQLPPTQQSLFSIASKEELPEWDPQQAPDPVSELVLLANFNKDSDPLGWRIEMLSVWLGGSGYSVPESKLKLLFEHYNPEWVITDDAKGLIQVLANLDIAYKFSAFDLVIAGYIVAEGQVRQDLDSVVSYFNLGLIKGQSDRLRLGMELYQTIKASLSENPKLRELVAVEQKLIPIVAQMERNGISLNTEGLLKDHDILAEAIDKQQQEIFAEVGHEFNVSSPKQVGEVLFAERGLQHGKKTKTGSYSTDERVLKELLGVDPLIEMLLNYRELTKLLSTYVKPLPTQVNPQSGRIHAVFNQLGAVTGRFSSKNPNMQNIPVGEVSGVNMRQAFVAAPGTVLVAFDYSQQELRLLSELSGEENMQQAFASGLDIHAKTASEIFNIPIEKVTKEQRKVGKTINFGVVYGMSAFGFADRLKVDQLQASKFIDMYFQRYPRVQIYFDELLSDGLEKGYVETIMGRRKSTALLRSPNYQLRKAAEREIINFPLQGSAADIIKMAMNRVAPILADYPVQLLLQVHDELIFEYRTQKNVRSLSKDKEFTEFLGRVRGAMLDVVKLKVPLEVGVEVGSNWADLEELEHAT